MTLKALLGRTDYEEIWPTLKAEYALPDKAYEAFRRAFCELLQIEPEPIDPPMTLYIEKEKNEFSDSGFRFEVFGRHNGDAEPYSLMMTPWAKWLSCEVDGDAILLYGIYAALAYILYEMTFYGYSSKAVYKKIKEIEASRSKAPLALPEGFEYYEQTILLPEHGMFNIPDAIHKIIFFEHPIHFDLICKPLLPLVGHKTVSRNIRKWVLRLIDSYLSEKVYCKDGFYYPAGETKIWARVPCGKIGIRPIEYISTDELAEALRVTALHHGDVPREKLMELTARTMGFSRMSKKVTQSLEKAYSQYSAR